MIIYKKDLSETNKKKFEEVEKKCKKAILSCSMSKIVLEIFFVLTIIFFFCSTYFYLLFNTSFNFSYILHYVPP